MAMRRIALARPSCSGTPKNTSYTDAIFSYTPSTNEVSSEIAESERVAASVVAGKSLSSSRGKRNAITPPSGTISDRQPLMSKGLAIEKEIGVRYLVEANRGYALALSDGVDVMMPEQMQAWLHVRQHLIDRRLPRILDTWQWKGARRFVRKEDVHAA